MTPAELADRLSQIPDQPGQCPACWECTSCCATHHRLLAAALRLAEAVVKCMEASEAIHARFPDYDVDHLPNHAPGLAPLDAALQQAGEQHRSALAAYRSARERLARAAP